MSTRASKRKEENNDDSSRKRGKEENAGGFFLQLLLLFPPYVLYSVSNTVVGANTDTLNANMHARTNCTQTHTLICTHLIYACLLETHTHAHTHMLRSYAFSFPQVKKQMM